MGESLNFYKYLQQPGPFLINLLEKMKYEFQNLLDNISIPNQVWQNMKRGENA